MLILCVFVFKNSCGIYVLVCVLEPVHETGTRNRNGMK
jgi:hypothetical protein